MEAFVDGQQKIVLLTAMRFYRLSHMRKFLTEQCRKILEGFLVG